MKGKTAVMMGATIAMVAAVAMLVFLLLAELYCTLLLRTRRRSNNTSPTSIDGRREGSPSSLCTFYAQGVIRTPRSFLFPAPEIPNSGKQLFRSSNREAASSPDSELIYICNPMYNGDGGVVIGNRDNTPFETPASSPNIETGSSGDEKCHVEEEGASVSLGLSISSSSSPSSPW
ncbi:uncharacterized protein LOC125210794 [Salvia hispanica]|uniref:uncharacterized protein LOC125210794 n=1 Tax=Salvia hispanica TaxID=49212 RepID=UPI002009098F|nr:uncharacterized protein LOC125210794 [Salvia hispanica]